MSGVHAHIHTCLPACPPTCMSMMPSWFQTCARGYLTTNILQQGSGARDSKTPDLFLGKQLICATLAVPKGSETRNLSKTCIGPQSLSRF